MPMRPFKIADLKGIAQLPQADAEAWLASGEKSVDFLKVNAGNDEIVIYASADGVLIHGVLRWPKSSRRPIVLTCKGFTCRRPTTVGVFRKRGAGPWTPHVS
jgi:hypothetical protein